MTFKKYINEKVDVDKLKLAIEKEFGSVVVDVKILEDDNIVDFKDENKKCYWAKLTAGGKLKKNSIRVDTT